MERNLLTILGITVILLFVSGCSQEEENYEIVGDTVMINDSLIYIATTPHTLYYSQWVEAEFESKVFSGQVDFLWGFDTEDGVYPTKAQRWTGSEWVNWNPGGNTDYEFMGMNKWYYSLNTNINAGTTYKVRYWLEVPYGAEGKYLLAFKPSAETIGEAIDNDHLWVLDPWYDTPSLDTDLEAYWSFDGGPERYNLTDLTGNGHNLTLINTPTHVPGFLNDSWNVSGNSALNISDMSFGNVFTISAWHNFSADETEVLNGADIISRPGAEPNRLIITGDKTNPGSNGGDYVFVVSTNNIGSDLGKFSNYTFDWNFVLGTFNNDTGRIELWVGNQTDLQNWSSTGAYITADDGLGTANTTYLGNRAAGGDYHSGRIDEIGIWTRELSYTEIVALWNSGAGVTYEENPFISNHTITPDPAYFNSTLNCSFIGGTGTDFNATLNWTNATDSIENNIYTNQANGTIISDSLAGQNEGSAVICIGSVYNSTNTYYNNETITISNYAPTIPTTFTPSNYSSSFDDSPTITCSGSTDPDGGTITYNISVNGTLVGVSPYAHPGDINEFNYSCQACDDSDGCSASTSENQYQPVQFGWCNATILDPLINFTFVDEETLANVNGTANTDWDLLLNGSITDFQYTNSSEAPNWQFCSNSTNDLWHDILANITFIYGGADYESRTYSVDELPINDTVLTNITLYQINSDTAALYNIYTLTVEGGVISGTEITIELSIGGTWTQVAVGTTDAAGSISFYLSPTSTYRVTAEATGYPTFQEDVIFGGQTDYTITMGESTYSDIEGNSTLDGLTWTIRPSPGVLNFGEVYTFEYNISSNRSNLIGCNFTLENRSDGIVFDTQTGCAAGDDELSTTFNMSTHTIDARFYYQVSGMSSQECLSCHIAYHHLNTSRMGGTLVEFFNNTQTLFETDGGTDSEKASAVMWMFFFMVIGIGITAYYSGWEVRNPYGLALLTLAPLIAMSWAGLLTVDYTPSDFLDQYMVVIVAALYLGIFIIRAHKRGLG